MADFKEISPPLQNKIGKKTASSTEFSDKRAKIVVTLENVRIPFPHTIFGGQTDHTHFKNLMSSPPPPQRCSGSATGCKYVAIRHQDK